MLSMSDAAMYGLSFLAVAVLIVIAVGAAILLAGLWSRLKSPCNEPHPAHKDWFPLVQGFDYDKKFYDVKLNDGTIIEHCWPNAGRFTPMAQADRTFGPEDNVCVRWSVTHPCDRYEG